LITEIFLQLANFQMQSNNSFCFVLKTKWKPKNKWIENLFELFKLESRR
jgi:hypothetical protein